MSGDDRAETLDAMQVFTNSGNTVDVLEALADGATASGTLTDQTDASRSTVARILDKGEEREWITSEGSRYELTYNGELMLDAFREYLQRVEEIRQLGSALNYLPPVARTLEVEHFHDAEIVQQTKADPFAPHDRGLERIREAERYRGLTQIALPSYVEALRDGVEAGRLTVEGVIEAEFVETLRASPDRADNWQAFADHIWVYDGAVPVNMHLIDGSVLLWLSNFRRDQWNVYGLLQSENPAVVAWAESLYEQYREDAETLDATTLAAD